MVSFKNPFLSEKNCTRFCNFNTNTVPLACCKWHRVWWLIVLSQCGREQKHPHKLKVPSRSRQLTLKENYHYFGHSWIKFTKKNIYLDEKFLKARSTTLLKLNMRTIPLSKSHICAGCNIRDLYNKVNNKVKTKRNQEKCRPLDFDNSKFS